MNISLQLEVERLDDGTWMVDAVWLKEAIHGDTFEEVFWKAKRFWWELENGKGKVLGEGR